MGKETTFMVYCMEIVKYAKRLSGKQVYALFDRYGLFSFIADYYELLHVHGEGYILDDIDARIAEVSAG